MLIVENLRKKKEIWKKNAHSCTSQSCPVLCFVNTIILSEEGRLCLPNIHSFIQQRSIQHLLCVRCCSRCWRHTMNQVSVNITKKKQDEAYRKTVSGLGAHMCTILFYLGWSRMACLWEKVMFDQKPEGGREPWRHLQDITSHIVPIK